MGSLNLYELRDSDEIVDKYMFGLEVEADFPNIIEFPHEAEDLWYSLREIIRAMPQKVERIIDDDSLYMGGIEITSPILCFYEIAPWVKAVVARIELDTYISHRCGGHIHVSPSTDFILDDELGLKLQTRLNKIKKDIDLPNFRKEKRIKYRWVYNSLEFRPWKGTFKPEQWAKNAIVSAQLLDWALCKEGYVL